MDSDLCLVPSDEKIIVLSYMGFKMVGDSDSGNAENMERIHQNLLTLKSLVCGNPADVLVELAHLAGVPQIDQIEVMLVTAELDVQTTYSLYLGNLLLNFSIHLDFGSLSEFVVNVCKDALKELRNYGINYQLLPQLQHSDAFRGTLPKRDQKPHYIILKVMVKVFSLLLENKTFAPYYKVMITDYMAAIFTLFHVHKTKELELSDSEQIEMQMQLNYMWAEVKKVKFFNSLMIIASVPNLPGDMMDQLNYELLQKLSSPNGFEMLIESLHSMGFQSQLEQMMHVAVFRCNEVDYQAKVTQQAFNYLVASLDAETDVPENIAVALNIVYSLYTHSVANCQIVEKLLRAKWMNLEVSTEFYPVGTTLMDHTEFNKLLRLMVTLYSVNEKFCLPAEGLINYVAALLQIYNCIHHKMPQKHVVKELIVYAMGQRQQSTVTDLMLRLYLQRFDKKWVQLHDCLAFELDIDNNKITPIVGSIEQVKLFKAAVLIPDLLMKSKSQALLVRMFIVLLHQIDKVCGKEASTIALVGSEAKRHSCLVDTVYSVKKLAQYNPLKAMLYENSVQFHHAVQGLTWLPGAEFGTIDKLLKYLIGLAEMPLTNI